MDLIWDLMEADWSTRLDATSLLTRIRCADSAAVISTLLGAEDDDALRAYLGTAAAAQFDDRLVPEARAVLDEDPTDPERAEIRALLVALSHLSGLDLPERDAWKQRVDADDDRRSRLNAPAESPHAWFFPEFFDDSDGGSGAWSDADGPADSDLQRGSPVGRNEPCPCGSGKKSKRCCLQDAPG